MTKKPPQKAISIADRVLQRKKDKALQQELRSEQIDLGDDAEAVQKPARRAMTNKEQAKRKKMMKFAMIGGGVMLFAWLVVWLFAPYKGGMTFGVCRVFLEQNVQYPHTLRLSQVEEINDFIRIWYAQIDGFGEYRLDNIRCTFEADEYLGFKLKKVSFNRRVVDPKKIEAFNRSLPVVFAN
ncbi:MAG: hypothetical protein ACRBCT_02645, partial [Alphaproteobacteria bacterium]